MRTINHPSIIKLYEFIETSEHYFLILELCDGGELFHQIVNLTYFSEDLSRHCIRQVADGIRYLHEEKGIVHRDIKPENLLFNSIPFMERVSPPPPQMEDDEPKEDEGEFIPGLGGGGIGRVKIADFGLSKVVWDQETMTPCGTVGYTAPEIVRDERYSKSVDMWALGCVLYTLLCGFPPFYDENIQILTEKVAHGQYTFLSPWWDSISSSAKDLISHLLCVDPNERYTIDQFFEHPWMTEVFRLHSNCHGQGQLKNGTKDLGRTDAKGSNSNGVTLTSSTTDDEEEGEVSPSDTSTNATADTEDDSGLDNNTDTKATSAAADGLLLQHHIKEYGNSTPASAPRNIPNATNALGDSTSPSSRRHELFSPGINTMKEIFDVSYAVQRITEEGSRKKKCQAFGHPLNIDCDSDNDQDIIKRHLKDDDEAEAIRSQLENSLSLKQNHSTGREAPPPSQEEAARLLSRGAARGSNTITPLFELSMDNSTLLGRRRNTANLTSPLDRAQSTHCSAHLDKGK
ncbi:kinase-like domain-containing protein [Dichotomocladium elegans]|nr:kinase-like domain-containing protein [Dichotomocladium elegans]